MMVHKTRLLMENDTLRKQMGQKAMETSKRYQPEKIMFQWKKLLNEIREK
jgi:glycosyltransferase involved in cell wall biosynthesis